jgi:hypothetical protein
MTVLYSISYYVRVLKSVTFTLIFAGRVRVYPSEHLLGLNTRGRILALHSSIILEWKGLTVINTSAYYNKELITGIKSLIVQASDALDK